MGAVILLAEEALRTARSSNVCLMIADKKIDLVLVKSANRFVREVADGLETIRELVFPSILARKRSIRLYSIQQPVEYHKKQFGDKRARCGIRRQRPCKWENTQGAFRCHPEYPAQNLYR